MITLKGTFIAVLLASCSLCYGAESNECELQLSCGDCISLPQCAWCSDLSYANFTNVLIPRCDLKQNLLKNDCPRDRIQDPKSKITFTQDDPLSKVGESDVGKATQIKPQIISVEARAGEKITINLSYRQAEDYPVDLYYLLDLSQSMKDDLEKLRELGITLGTKMQSITRDFRLGFGSFIDKTVMPYISTLPEKLANPCDKQSPCVPTYGFHNDLPLTSDIEKFEQSVQNVMHSSNQDNPEGSLDAMMQSIVCENQVGWRNDSTHLLLLSTDANFHYAGDGKLGGIVFPNDGKCHLDQNGSYTMSDKMDYPSIGHLVQKISEHKIQPIFAVTSRVKDTYDKFAEMIPKSVVEELQQDSSNIIGLIENAYKELKEEVVLELKNVPKELDISGYMSKCPNDKVTEGELKCNEMNLNSNASFSFDITMDKLDYCYNEPFEITVALSGYNEKAIILITPICNCNCSTENYAAAVDNDTCSEHGSFECGACVCDPGFIGLDCGCNHDVVVLGADYQQNCTMDDAPDVCSGRGQCQCGTCLCNRIEGKTIDGKYCQCDSTNCPRFEGKICNDQGTCKCNECKCNEGFSGSKCDCSTDQSGCKPDGQDKNNTEVCSGNGQCGCNQCECFDDELSGNKFRGIYCENAPSSSCFKHKPCIECKAFQTGEYNQTCEEKCGRYQVIELGKDQSESYKLTCTFQDLTDNCVYEVWYSEKNDEIYAEYRSEKRCSEYLNPTWLVVGVILAVVGIGIAALLVWKVYTSMKDAREYKNFIRESQNVKFEGGENPIYKQATSTFQNPTFTPGKPTSNL